jgi:hypothetical protein
MSPAEAREPHFTQGRRTMTAARSTRLRTLAWALIGASSEEFND